eukprot:CAMPEP_0172454538 /NCGR_PEP_ID=MMETSP1065-20121228/11499_1 /TAXON_ID=265537 /ORGANISM="Amphiprora paludosa, Strain CCMP125" /LENGTH=754 /DNA_ID=CAMNT_0013206881 /DNA_START=55 /DNA_END=2319 /DNA_ORIENTATION=-
MPPSDNNGGDKPASPRYMDVALEMTGNPKVGSHPNVKPFCKKLAKSPTSLRFIVQKLPLVMDAPMADHVTSLILDELERLPVPGRVAKIVLSGLKFTDEGALTLQGFLESHAPTIRHVALHNLLVRPTLAPNANAQLVADAQEEFGLDCDCVLGIMQAFETAPLAVLDLSRNVLHGKDIWKSWHESQHRSAGQMITIKQFILDSVDLDHDSWMGLVETFVWEGMDDLHIVLEHSPPTDQALQASQDIVKRCLRLSSLRWIQKRGPDQPLPWTGLRDMTKAVMNSSPNGGNSQNNSNNSNNPSNSNVGKRAPLLRHLVLEGPGTPEFCKPHHMTDLAGALECLPRLKTLKLRHLGLTDLASICVALRAARPPLEVMDFSYNEVSSAGAHRLGDLMRVTKIASQLQLIVMNDNRIETNVARELLETFHNLISLDNNPGVDFCRIITEVMTVQKQLEKERNELRQQLEQRAYESGGANAEILQKENRRLREERDMLAKAFSIIGISHEVEEHKRLLERIQRIEDVMVLGAVFKGGHHHGGGAGATKDAIQRVASSSAMSVMSTATGSGASEVMGSKSASRRRMNINDLHAQVQGGRSPSNTSLQQQRVVQRGLVRTNSNRSTTSRGTAGGGSIFGGDLDDNEAGGATLESPHPNRQSIGRGGVSSAASDRSVGRQYRTPNQGQRNTLSPHNSSTNGGLPHVPTTPDLDRTGSGGGGSGHRTSSSERLEPSLRRSTYSTTGSSTSSPVNSRRGSSARD